MPNYRNKSKFYKNITLDGKRINVPPKGVFLSVSALDLNIFDYLEEVNDQPTITIKPIEKKKVVEQTEFKKLETAILKLNNKLNENNKGVEDTISKILEKTPEVESEEIKLAIKKVYELEKYIKETIDKRQKILRESIDEVNNAVIELEKYVYEDNHLPIVIEEVSDTGNKEISIEDILKGTK